MFRTGVTAVRTQVRSASTRAKKINVQLLKEPYGRRLRGEVFPVSEGHMRLKLHPQNIAAYVVPNQEPVIPILPAAEAQRIRREMQVQAKADAAAAELAREEQQAGQIPASEKQASDRHSKVLSLLDSLDFPSFSSDTATAPISNTKSESDDSPVKTESSSKQFAWQNDLVVNITNRK